MNYARDWKPVPSHPGVRLLVTRAPLEPSSTHNCECSRAEKWALKSSVHHRPHAINTAITLHCPRTATIWTRPLTHNNGQHVCPRIGPRPASTSAKNSSTPCSIAQQARHRRPCSTSRTAESSPRRPLDLWHWRTTISSTSKSGINSPINSIFCGCCC